MGKRGYCPACQQKPCMGGRGPGSCETGTKSGGKSNRRIPDPTGPGADRGEQPPSRFDCPRGGQHNYGWLRWRPAGPTMHERDQYCTKCRQVTGAQLLDHKFNRKGICTDCGYSR